MKPRASFVIPVKDGQAYLAETLESCLKQTAKRFEVVIVDDGSTDGTWDLISFYRNKDERIRAIRFDKNQGRSEARNAGIREAKTDILMMMDADDLASENRVADTIAFFKKNPRADIMYGEFQIMDALGTLVGNQAVIPFDFEKAKESKLFYIGHSTVAFHRRVSDKVQYSSGDWSKHAIDDWKFYVDAHRSGFTFHPLKRIMMRYRWIPKPRDEAYILKIKNECLASA